VAGSQDVIQAAVTDVISPAVAAEDPEALLGQVLLVLQDLLGLVAATGLQGSDQGLCGLVVGLGVVLGLQELVDDSIQLSVLTLQGLNLGDQVGADGLVTDLHAQAVLGVILEQELIQAGP
jgi:hypothetical protein